MSATNTLTTERDVLDTLSGTRTLAEIYAGSPTVSDSASRRLLVVLP